jgi:hypothetical protein
MSKTVKREISDWAGLIASVKDELHDAKMRVSRLEAALATFRENKRKHMPFPGETGSPSGALPNILGS